jgi:POT family proton-dependent oligopeptide transporter
MVSIVALEFAYTQAPKTMKSLLMCYYLGAVALGNFLVAQVNHFIQIPSAAAEQFEAQIKTLPADWRNSTRTVILAGFDGVTGQGDDDFIQKVEEGRLTTVTIPGQAAYESAVAKIVEAARRADDRLPPVNSMTGLGNDPWGSPIRYEILNSSTFRVISDGPDRRPFTRWDQGIIVEVTKPEAAAAASWFDRLRPEVPWLDTRKKALGIVDEAAPTAETGTRYKSTAFSGGQTKLRGAAYFNFFTWLMLGTAVAFIPFALAYRSRTILQD